MQGSYCPTLVQKMLVVREQRLECCELTWGMKNLKPLKGDAKARVTLKRQGLSASNMMTVIKAWEEIQSTAPVQGKSLLVTLWHILKQELRNLLTTVNYLQETFLDFGLYSLASFYFALYSSCSACWHLCFSCSRTAKARRVGLFKLTGENLP